MVYVLLAEGFEEIEALAVVDVLRRAKIEVCMVSIREKKVRGGHGICVEADCVIEEVDADKAKMLVLPGGMPGTTHLDQSDLVQALIADMVERGKWVAAICAAPMILGKRGYLAGKKAICYPGFEAELKGAVIVEQKVNIDEPFITSKGPGTALDFAFSIVAVLKDKKVAAILKEQMQIAE